MKRTKYTPEQLNTYRALAGRAQLAQRLSTQTFDGNRNTYKEFGYPLVLTFKDFMARYIRQDIAKAIIDRPVKKTWGGEITVVDVEDNEKGNFEKAWDEMYKDWKLASIFTRVDKLTGIGKYGVLLLGLNDVSNAIDYQTAVVPSKNLKLTYLKPLSEASAEIMSYETDPANERYGKPLMYQLTLGDEEGTSMTNTTLHVHYTRVLHIVDEILESETEGIPRLEPVYNRLIDLEKLIGGDAEMFWKGARPGFTGKVDKDFNITEDFEKNLDTQIAEYENGLSRVLALSGMDFKELTQAISDPKSHVDVQIQMVSAETGIPKRILTGSERGELASSQDADEWNEYGTNRRSDFAEPNLLRVFIDTMVKYKIMPEPAEGNYTVQWQDLYTVSDAEKAKVGETRAKTLKEYTTNLIAAEMVPPKAFMKFFLGFSDEDIETVEAMLEDMQSEETPLSAVEKALLDKAVSVETEDTIEVIEE